MKLAKVVLAIGVALPVGATLLIPSQSKKVDFGTEIAPIFKAHCMSCHSAETARGDLRLDTPENIKKGGDSGALFIGANPSSSVLVRRIKGLDGLPQMPKGFPALKPDEIQKISDWIEQGASFAGVKPASKHWAYIAPAMPKPPATKLKAWQRNSIDSFVLAKLEKSNLKPSPEASRATLIRRLSLDLIGLPPTPGEVAEFVKDSSPTYYEKAVDRLLASPHYGERQARAWLDLARYADSNGFEKDDNRTMWLYRDWVINAFNRNLPYDKFSIEQIAGDLLPNPTTDQLIATGFNRNTMLNLEGGVDQAEALYYVLLDRVNTTSTVWMGSTMACTRCHDHKFDPLTQKDYFQMYAYFGSPAINKTGPASVSEEKWHEAEIKVPNPGDSERIQGLRVQIAALKATLSPQSPEVQQLISDTKNPAKWYSLPIVAASTTSGAKLMIQPDQSLLATGSVPNTDHYAHEFNTQGRRPRALRITLIPDPQNPIGGAGRSSGGNFVLTGLAVGNRPLGDIAASFTQEGFDPTTIVDNNRDKGWAIYPRAKEAHVLIAEFKSESSPLLKIDLDFNSGYAQHVLGHYKIEFCDERLALLELAPADIKALAAKQTLTEKETTRLAEYLSQFTVNGRAMKKLKKDLGTLEAASIPALVMRDDPAVKVLRTHMKRRGEFLGDGEEVGTQTPATFGPTPSNLPKNRLGLAQWLFSKQNPLAARVEVNRIWEQIFGRGIVETTEDFGTRSSPPTHPELLDYLAVKFMAGGWNLKALQRLIVTSATYRQSSSQTPKLREKDPDNLLLSRGPRFRMEAESVRDIVLMASGLLDKKVGGPSVFPAQPDGVWNGPYSSETWMQSKGGDQHRRGIYTFVKRTAPYPTMMSFDGTSREECTVRRIRTNTPLQALALMNDPVVLEASRALGQRMMEFKGSADQKLLFGFQCCTGTGSPRGIAAVKALLSKNLAHFRANPAEAKKFAGTPEQAAYTLVANVLLSMDETITKS
ncbi:MAG: PSD1 and planctomycete cytochrome C domain-containing protein [Armatimonadetes bacterium]|nr:PSD1 and planctomycete cytochrome C domain-containing protein [Armatimonadota bacterium]